jgi:hypothetical protein
VEVRAPIFVAARANLEVHVGEEDHRRDRGPIVEVRAPIFVAARANLEVERTVDVVQPVLLGAEDRSPIIADTGSTCDARRQLLWVVALMIWWLGLIGRL